MPIRFSAGSFKGVTLDRQKDVYRLLHIAFDHGLLYDAGEIEAAWEQANGNWAALPEKDDDVWSMLEKTIPPEIA